VRANEDGEGFLIAMLGTSYEVVIHLVTDGVRSIWARLPFQRDRGCAAFSLACRFV
jgi:hypothetical protein